MHVWNVRHAARWKYRTQKSRQKSQSGHHRTTLSGYIFSIKARIDNRKKLVKHQYLLYMFPQYGELRPTSGWDRSGSLGTPANFNGFRILTALLHGSLVVGVSQTLRRWTEGATYIRRAAITLGIGPHSSLISILHGIISNFYLRRLLFWLGSAYPSPGLTKNRPYSERWKAWWETRRRRCAEFQCGGVWGGLSHPQMTGGLGGENAFWRISKATERSFLHLYTEILGGARPTFGGGVNCPLPQRRTAPGHSPRHSPFSITWNWCFSAKVDGLILTIHKTYWLMANVWSK